jgi:hypothetical protein
MSSLSYFLGYRKMFFSDGRGGEWENVFMTTSLPQHERLKIEKLLAQLSKLKASPKQGSPRAKNLSSAAPWHLES